VPIHQKGHRGADRRPERVAPQTLLALPHLDGVHRRLPGGTDRLLPGLPTRVRNALHTDGHDGPLDPAPAEENHIHYRRALCIGDVGADGYSGGDADVMSVAPATSISAASVFRLPPRQAGPGHHSWRPSCGPGRPANPAHAHPSRPPSWTGSSAFSTGAARRHGP